MTASAEGDVVVEPFAPRVDVAHLQAYTRWLEAQVDELLREKLRDDLGIPDLSVRTDAPGHVVARVELYGDAYLAPEAIRYHVTVNGGPDNFYATYRSPWNALRQLYRMTGGVIVSRDVDIPDAPEKEKP